MFTGFNKHWYLADALNMLSRDMIVLLASDPGTAYFSLA
jgi:hypothetical protein